MIGSVLLEEMYYVLKDKREYDEKKYESALKKKNRTIANALAVPFVPLRAADLFDLVGNTQKAAHYHALMQASTSSSGTAYFSDFDILSGAEPIVRESKIYPNDPCPCGSGKKYKKCCK